MRHKIDCFFNAITIAALCLFSFPALIIASTSALNENLLSLKRWSLFMIALIDFLIVLASLFLRHFEINTQQLKNLSVFLTATLGLMMYGVSSMLTHIFLEKEIAEVFAYQAFATIIVGILVGTVLYFLQHELRQEDTMSIPIAYTYFVLASAYILCKAEILDLNDEMMWWTRVSSVFTFVFGSASFYISSNKAFFGNICEEVCMIAFAPVSIFLCLQGILYIMQQAMVFKPDNLHFLILCSLILIWSVAPIVVRSAIWIAESSWAFFSLAGQNGLESRVENQTNTKFDTDFQCVKSVRLENVKEKNCPICWEEFNDSDEIIARDLCCHCYHKSCLKKWVVRDSRCPLCRGFIYSDPCLDFLLDS